MTVDDLRAAPIFADLDDADLARAVELGSTRHLAPGEVLFTQGEDAKVFYLVLDGFLETSRDVGGDQVLMFSHGAGGYMGALALLAGNPYRGTTRAVEDSQVFELDGDELRRLALKYPSVLRQIVPAAESVSAAIKSADLTFEKLLAVGKLAAGLAHELNNPAAAAARGVKTLRDYERQRQEAFAEVAAGGAPAEQLGALVGIATQATDKASAATRADPLEASDREQALMDALASRGLDDAYDTAATLTEAGLDAVWADRVADSVGEANLSAGLRFVAACAGARVVLAELEDATRRIADLVGAVKTYSYLDQGPTQAVDLHEGLESTLVLLGHKLRAKQVDIVRQFAPDLPKVQATGSELNQVWTNLIDNAVDAMPVGGRLTLTTRLQGGRVLVEVGDNGPGIPAEEQSRIFEAFYTTKPVGQGTGLGLDIAQRIVVRHHGELRIDSQPGDTRFQVILPLQ